jgi:hypothetical protein
LLSTAAPQRWAERMYKCLDAVLPAACLTGRKVYAACSNEW